MADYTLQHTGAEVDEAVQKALDITSTPANIDVAVAQELATTDYVVEQGTSGIWTWRKWKSGIAECWGIDTLSGAWSTWGSIYFLEKFINFPSGLFISAPQVNADPHGSTQSSWCGIYTANTTKDGTARALFRPTAGDGSKEFKISVSARGRWKQ